MQGGGETAALLQSLEVFSELEERELIQVAQVAVPRSFERGEVIFREGDTGSTLYVVRSGSVSIHREHMDGRRLALAELRHGDMFGELALFSGETRSATAEAMELVPRERFVPVNQRRRAYRDGALPIGEGQTISQPWIVARMAAALELEGVERVLEVGTGSGYGAAVLSRCCSHVVTVERREGAWATCATGTRSAASGC